MIILHHHFRIVTIFYCCSGSHQQSTVEDADGPAGSLALCTRTSTLPLWAAPPLHPHTGRSAAPQSFDVCRIIIDVLWWPASALLPHTTGQKSGGRERHWMSSLTKNISIAAQVLGRIDLRKSSAERWTAKPKQLKEIVNCHVRFLCFLP